MDGVTSVYDRLPQDACSFIEQRFGVSLRPGQLEIIDRVARDIGDKEIFIIEAPTGIGKSLIALGLAEFFKAPSLYVTPTVYLQTQYLRDFRRFFGSEDTKIGHEYYWGFIAGRRHYPCPYLEEKIGSKMDGSSFTADDCVMMSSSRPVRCPYAMHRSFDAYYDRKLLDDLRSKYDCVYFPACLAYFSSDRRCPYHAAKMRANMSRHLVTNYDFFLLDYAFVNDMHVRPFLVFDEAHNLFDIVRSSLSYSVSFEYLASLGVDIPADVYYSSAHGGVFSVINVLLNAVGRRISEIIDEGSLFSDFPTVRKLHEVYVRLSYASRYSTAYKKYSRVVKNVLHLVPDSDDLIASIIRDYFASEPLYLVRNGYMHPYFNSSPDNRRIFFLSATVGPPSVWQRIIRMAGVPLEKVLYISSVSSPFDVSRRLVYYVDWGKPFTISAFSTYDHNKLSFISSTVLYLYSRLSEWGVRRALLVHAYRVDLAEAIYEHMSKECTDYNVDPGEVNVAVSDMISYGDTIHEAVQNFVEHGGILITSTGAAEGVDLPGDTCRLQVIAKAPFPSLYYPSHLRDFYIAKTIVQMSGRVVRSRSDFGYTIILDSAALKHYLENGMYYPEYFKEAVVIGKSFEEVVSDIGERVKAYAKENAVVNP